MGRRDVSYVSPVYFSYCRRLHAIAAVPGGVIFGAYIYKTSGTIKPSHPFNVQSIVFITEGEET